MCRRATVWALAGVLAAGLTAQAQNPTVDWRHIGNSAVELGLPALATGAVDRVWYSPDGSVLYARTEGGRIFQTSDFERWTPANARIAAPAEASPVVATLPEPGARVSMQASAAGRIYATGSNVYRSDDGGLTWSNLTGYKGLSILGDGLADSAASPRDPDEMAVASSTGVWRTMDAGITWSGINDLLPNLPSGRLVAVPTGTRGVRMSLGASTSEIEWAPGEKSAWKPVEAADLVRESQVKSALSSVLKRSITAFATSKDYIYAGDSEGRLQVSADGGTSWGTVYRAARELGPVEAIWVDASDARIAVAVFGARSSSGLAKPTYVARTMNGGIFWDDVTDNLPDRAAAHGVAADRASGAIYVATDAGVFFTTTDLVSAGRPTPWTSLGQGLPAARATDVRLDAGANQLYIALDGYGVYVAIAPHRLRDARVVSAADYSTRAAAPGALLSVLGTRVESARSANTVVPILDASSTASQIQVPFEAKGNALSLSLEASAGRFTVGLPLQDVAPAIFVDPEGTPLIMDASNGVMLDASKPAHANARIQILATGLGRVTPDWPTGLAAPLADPPRVLASVRAFVDHAPVEVTQASLAPGYIGFYLVEIQLPRINNTGPVELYLEAQGQQSNRVRLYIDQ